MQNCLTITDTGIGMTRDEMIENLGTIAHSGSEAFLKEHTQTAEDGTASDASNIIGRFGIGFYSVFMVADKVEVTSLSATGDGPAYRWISDGTGTFTVEEAPDQADIKRGTTIRAFIKEAEAKGHSVTGFDAAEMHVGGCHACETCYKTGKACSFDDDFNLIAPAILDADAVVFCMPV